MSFYLKSAQEMRERQRAMAIAIANGTMIVKISKGE